ncbi:unnamed protein product, partial [Rotaria sp. Silwood2]
MNTINDGIKDRRDTELTFLKKVNEEYALRLTPNGSGQGEKRIRTATTASSNYSNISSRMDKMDNQLNNNQKNATVKTGDFKFKITRNAITYAVEQNLPAIRLECEPKLNEHKDGNLLCYTNNINLFVFLCDVQHAPNKIINTNVKVILPKHLPHKRSIIIKGVPNSLCTEDIKNILAQKFTTIYIIDEILGTNNGIICMEGQCLHVVEYLAAPRVLFCSKRCGGDRNVGQHNECEIRCHNCKEEHLSTDYKCVAVQCYRRDLIQHIQQHPESLPNDTQLFIPSQYRRQGDKTISNRNEWPLLPPPTRSTISFSKYSTTCPSDIMNNFKLLLNQTELNCALAKEAYDRKNMEIKSQISSSINQIQSLITCCSSVIQKQNEAIAVLKNAIYECLEFNRVTNQALCFIMDKSGDQHYVEISKQLSSIPFAERQSSINKLFSTYAPILDEFTMKLLEVTQHLQLNINNETIPERTLIGAVYVPPGKSPPLHLFSKCRNKPFFIFGDFNAKHSSWDCDINNDSGNQIASWLEQTGNSMILPNKSTSRRSNSIIDFGLTQDASGWITEVLDEGTSDHYPILIQSPLFVENSNKFRCTNWSIFSYFLRLVHQYWLSLVYNYDEQYFFSYFNNFLSSLWDRSSIYKSARTYRLPWPPYLVLLARQVNGRRRTYRRNKTIIHLIHFLRLKELFLEERSKILKQKFENKFEWIKKDNNIWKFTRPIFHAFTPPFRGITTNDEKIKQPKKIVDLLADHYEKHFDEPEPDNNNLFHCEYLSIYDKISRAPTLPSSSSSSCPIGLAP